MRYQMNKIEKILCKYGPGGRDCPCCGPAPKDRKAFNRTAKRRFRALGKKSIARQLLEMKS